MRRYRVPIRGIGAPYGHELREKWRRMSSILAMLHADGPWGDLWRQAVESPTVPQLVMSAGEQGGAGAARPEDMRRSGRQSSAPPASPEA